MGPKGMASLALAGVSVITAFASTLAEAYTPTVTPSGVSVRWKGRPKINLAGNPTNQSGFDAGSFYSAVVRGLQRWKSASGGSILFDYWQGTDTQIYEPNSEYNGLSSIYFATNENGKTYLPNNVLGLTQVWYDTKTGEVIEADVALNDRAFQFTTNSRDTSGYGTGGSSSFGGKPKVFIENVITHELGHAFGLSHSGELQATMLFMESPEQAYLSCDELVGIRTIYPSDGGARGILTGTIVSESGQPVFGAHVLAISRARGTVLASAITDRSGSYRIGALEPGTYFLMAEPFYAGAAPLPAYYADIKTQVCSDERSFGRTMLSDDSSNRLIGIDVPANGVGSAPTMTVRCAQSSGASIAAIASSRSMSSAPVIYDVVRDSNGFGITDKFNYSTTTYYRLAGLSGKAEIHALSYSLYSPVRAVISLLDSKGNPVQVTQYDQAYHGESGYINFDSYLVASNLASGDYYLEVKSSSLDSTYYPAGPVSLDSSPFLVITGTLNGSTPSLADELPNNPRCRTTERFASYSSPGGNPPRNSVQREDIGSGFCGRIERVSGSDGDDSGPGAGGIAGWFLPWVFMGVAAQVMRAMARLSRKQRPLADPAP